MKNLLSILLAVLLFNLANAKAPDSVFVQQSALNLSQPDFVPAWCNTFQLQVSIGGFGLTTSISTSFDLCCVAMI